MRLGKTLKVLYDIHIKQVRDRNARDDYVRMEKEDKMNRLILSLIQDGRQEDIANAISGAFLFLTEDAVRELVS